MSLLSLLPGLAWANSTPVISEGDLLNQLLRNHPVKSAADAAVDASEGELTSGAGIFDPKLMANWTRTPVGSYENSRYDIKVEQLVPLYGLKVFGGYARAQGNWAIYDGKLLTGTDGELYFGFDLPLLRGGLTDEGRTKLDIVDSKFDQAQFDRSQELTQLVKEARIKYWDWVLAHYKYDINRSFLKLAQDRDRALERRAQTGDLATIDRKDNLRLIYSRQNRVNTVELEWVSKTQEVSIYWRDAEGKALPPIPGQAPATIDDPVISPPDLETLMKRAEETRPELKSIEQKLKQVEATQSLAKNSILPALNFKFERLRELGQVNTFFKAQNELRAGLYFELALPMRKGRGELIRAENELDAIRAKQQLVQDKLRAEVTSLHQKIKTLIQNLENSKNESQLAVAVADGERKRFLAGQSNIIAVNLREEAALDAQLKLAETRADLHQTKAELDALMNPVGL
jgi:outer membrane protein TolC